MKKLSVLLVALLALSACQSNGALKQLENISKEMKDAFAPDSREKVYQISFEKQKKQYIAKGVTTEKEAATALVASAQSQGIALVDSITVLPDPELGNKTLGVTALSVMNLRYGPDFEAESATQTIMGMPLRLLEKKDGWTRVITPEGYIAWVTSRSVREMDQAEYDAWRAAPKVIINKHYTLFREAPLPGAQVVSDGIWGNIVELIGQTPLYFKVRLPRGEEAYVSRLDAQLFDNWLDEGTPTPERIIATAMQFVGFPYLWAGTSVKAMDCSGFAKTTYYLNGLILLRDASQQARMGEPVDISTGWDHLQMGDLIFFGRKATETQKERVTHVGIYVGDGRFLHSSTYVRMNSLDPASDIYYDRSPNLVKAIRILNHVDDGTGVLSVKNHPWYKSE